MKTPRSSQTGVALVITLFFLVIVTVVVVGFLDTARMDRAAASSHLERMRANTFAQSGVEAVVATLQREAGDPPYNPNVANYVPRNWISEPGAIVTTQLVAGAPDPAGPTKLMQTVLLSSGQPTANITSGDYWMRVPDLNVETLIDQSPATHLITEQRNAGKAVEMKVRWVYVRQDGTADYGADNLPNENPDLKNIANPIVGRYGYWADDESAKVNYNLAWTRDTVNPNPAGHQTKVQLPALYGFTPTIAGNLHGLITADNYSSILHFYNSPFDARQRNDLATRTALDLNKFNLTHFNNDPDTTYYGRSRMMLTTQLSNAVLRDAKGDPVRDPNDSNKYLTRPFLDILKNPNNLLTYLDPGAEGTASAPATGNVDAVKLNTVVKDLVKNYLQRTDWPMVDGTGHSIQEKYYKDYVDPARTMRLAQLALNIIDYVRTAESKLMVVQPIRAKWMPVGASFDASVFTPDFSVQSIQGTDDTFKGLTRTPYITEQGIWVSDAPETTGTNIGLYKTYMFVEVYLPDDYGIDVLDWMNTDGKKWTLYVGEAGVQYTDSKGALQYLYHLPTGAVALNEYTVLNPRNTATSPTFIWDAKDETAAQVNTAASKTKMARGQYRTFAMELYRVKSKKDRPTAQLRAAITVSGGPRIDVAPLSTPLTYTLDNPNQGAPKVPTDPTPPETAVTSFETADPRVNGVTKDWTSTVISSFSNVNNARTASLSSAKAVQPPQDVGADGKVSAVSLRMPYPYLNANNVTGRVRSTGELGVIHTGIEGSNGTVAKPLAGIPWRSLRLQPNYQPTSSSNAITVVPDWAFMDLFTVPIDVPIPASSLFAPHSSSTGGRVNINARPAVFEWQPALDGATDPAELVNRTDALAAVFYGARKSSADTTATFTLEEARTIAKNIFNHKLAQASGNLLPGKDYPAAVTDLLRVYESPGEIVEILGVADRGEESEETVREISNLVTARGNVFSVYTVGQALKQVLIPGRPPKLIVTAEQRQHAMVERYLIGKGTAKPDDDEVRIRTIYSRNLVP